MERVYLESIGWGGGQGVLRVQLGTEPYRFPGALRRHGSLTRVLDVGWWLRSDCENGPALAAGWNFGAEGSEVVVAIDVLSRW